MNVVLNIPPLFFSVSIGVLVVIIVVSILVLVLIVIAVIKWGIPRWHRNDTTVESGIALEDKVTV